MSSLCSCGMLLSWLVLLISMWWLLCICLIGRLVFLMFEMCMRFVRFGKKMFLLVR